MIARAAAIPSPPLFPLRLGDARLAPTLAHLTGCGISAICPNGFVSPEASHCAHFVGHVLGLSFGCTCGALTGSGGPAANVRVHEIFARCSQAGPWKDRPAGENCLVFVSRPSIFDVTARTMVNIPKKHIGIVCGATVYHYTSSRDCVEDRTIAGFLAHFDEVYGEGQALYFGLID